MASIKKLENGKFFIRGTITIDQMIEAVREDSKNYFNREDFCATDPSDTKRYLEAAISMNESEVFGCLFLDTRHNVISFEILFYGTIDGASVYPREIVKRALHNNAAAVILTHNHPSGESEPSQADIAITKRISDALKLIDVTTLDHIIIGRANESTSLVEKGLM